MGGRCVLVDVADGRDSAARKVGAIAEAAVNGIVVEADRGRRAGRAECADLPRATSIPRYLASWLACLYRCTMPKSTPAGPRMPPPPSLSPACKLRRLII